jgi:hypothetical protein
MVCKLDFVREVLSRTLVPAPEHKSKIKIFLTSEKINK